MAKNLKDQIVMTCEAQEGCTRVFSFTVSEEIAQQEKSKVLNYIAGAVQLPGFRAGKAPLGLVAKKYDDAIVDELRNRVIGAAVQKIEDDKDLDLLGLNFKDMGKFEAGKEYKFSFEGSVAPEINLGDYKAMKIEIPLDAVEEKAIDERLDLYRTMYGTYADVDDAAKAEDMLKVDYKGDFALPEDASASLKRQVEAKDAFLWLNEPETIPGCVKALTGAEKGKEYKFTAEYPADYREAALAGKKVEYTVNVSAIQRRGKLNDEELLKRTGSKDMDSLRGQVRSALEADAAAKQRQDAAEAVYKRLSDAAGEFELPKALLENEIQKELQKSLRENVKSEADAEKFKAEMEKHRADASEPAKTAVRRALILRKLAKLENVSHEAGELENQMRSMSRYYGYKPRELQNMLEKSGAIDELRLDMLNAKVLDRLTEAALKK